MIELIIAVKEAQYFCQLHTEFYPTSFYQDYSIVPRKLFRIFKVDFDVTGQLLISSNTGDKMKIT
jgi:hypothetical protein